MTFRVVSKTVKYILLCELDAPQIKESVREREQHKGIEFLPQTQIICVLYI